MVANTPGAWDERASAGTSWEAALWSQMGQADRFRRVLSHLDLHPGDFLLDYGCGTGALSAELPAGIHYFGCDWSRAMRQRARAEHPGARRAIISPERLDRLNTRFDHVVAVGPFNLADGWSRDQTIERLEHLWRMTHRSLVVSLYRGHHPDCLHYAPSTLANWARRFERDLDADRWTIDGWRTNDAILALHRGPAC